MKNFRFTIICLILLLLCPIALFAQQRQSREEYIERYKAIAVAHMERYGIPASITMAQGILESDSGNSNLARKSNNHFGIKCKKDWTGERVYHNDDAPNECFRKYDSVEDSYLDHAEFLDKSPRYDSLFAYSATDYRSWARGLKAAGYATAKDYAERLIKLIEDNKLYLLDQDNGVQLYAARNRGENNIDQDFTTQSSVNTPTTHSGSIDPNKYRNSWKKGSFFVFKFYLTGIESLIFMPPCTVLAALQAGATSSGAKNKKRRSHKDFTSFPAR